MHAQGDPQDDAGRARLRRRAARRLRLPRGARRARPRRRASRAARILVDPGIGFGKTVAHNLALVRGLALLHGLGCAILFGASRKRFIGALGDAPDPPDRVPGSIAVALEALRQGAQVIRVHDVNETRQAVALWPALNGRRGVGGMARKLFGTDGVRGRANDAPMTAETALRLGQAAGRLLHQRRARAPGGDRQGHPPLGLHAGERADRGLHLGRHERLPGRPGADAGGRLADPLDARRPRGDDLGLAQPLPGQRHQVLRPRRLQALATPPRRRSRRCSRARRSSPSRRISAAPPASTTGAGATWSSPRPPSRAASGSTG